MTAGLLICSAAAGFIQYCGAGKARAGGCRSLCPRSYEMAASVVSSVYHDISANAL